MPSPTAEVPQPDCDRCEHPWEIHQHYRANLSDDCGMLTCFCHSYKRPPGKLVSWCRKWLW